MAIFWPASLPQAPEPSGYSHVERDAVMRSTMTYGPDKTRNKTLMSIHDVGMRFFIDNDDLATLMDFYDNTLVRVTEFNWTDHTTGLPAVYRFMAAPSKTPFGTALWWDVTLQLEIIG